MRPFQIILYGIFGALAVGGLIMFATYKIRDEKSDALRAGVTVWGTLDDSAFTTALSTIVETDERWNTVRYEEKDASTFSEELVNSIAEGRGPDLVVLPSDLIVTHATKLRVVPYDSFSVRQFRDTFTVGSEIFLYPNGFYGFPFAIDPLVMYWNRSMFASQKLVYPPRTWEELVTSTVRSITRRTDSNDIKTSTIAFGEYSNVTNAKHILSMLMLQANARMVEYDGTRYTTHLNEAKQTNVASPGDAALRFYTQFANPNAITYTWNRGLKNDRDAFLAEELALYVGFGSEYKSLQDGNANLDFDAALIPQGADENNKKTFGHIYAFAVPQTAKNQPGALEVAQTLSMSQYAKTLADQLGLAPAALNLLAQKSNDPVGEVVYSSGLIAKAWLDPKPSATDGILRAMNEAVTSGRAVTSDALNDAAYQIQGLFR
jgi:ABC-type glycerol-3-phosphate transport system substrate-binding protein